MHALCHFGCMHALCQVGNYTARLVAVDGGGAEATVLEWAFSIAPRPVFRLAVGNWDIKAEATKAGMQERYSRTTCVGAGPTSAMQARTPPCRHAFPC